MKKLFKIVMILIMFVAMGLSVLNFMSSSIEARIRNSDAVYVEGTNDCWTKYHIDCFIVDVRPPKR